MQIIKEHKAKTSSIELPDYIIYNPCLSWREKALFGFIMKLSQNTNQSCLATNKYLANLLDCSQDFASKAVSKLVKFGYINVKIVTEPNTKMQQRFIYVNTQAKLTYDKFYQKIDEVYNQGNSSLKDSLQFEIESFF